MVNVELWNRLRRWLSTNGGIFVFYFRSGLTYNMGQNGYFVSSQQKQEGDKEISIANLHTNFKSPMKASQICKGFL